jgi:hypothetical protein
MERLVERAMTFAVEGVLVVAGGGEVVTSWLSTTTTTWP